MESGLDFYTPPLRAFTNEEKKSMSACDSSTGGAALHACPSVALTHHPLRIRRQRLQHSQHSFIEKLPETSLFCVFLLSDSSLNSLFKNDIDLDMTIKNAGLHFKEQENINRSI